MTTSIYAGMTRSQQKRKRCMVKAKENHRALIKLLGDKCALCDDTWADSQLQIDHPNGRDQANHSAENRGKRWDVRVKAYWAEFYAGVKLRVLCIYCNSKDGRARQNQEYPPAPF